MNQTKPAREQQWQHIKSTLVIATMLAFSLVAPRIGLAHGKDVHDYYPKPKAYPLSRCLVSDEKLGEKGKPYVFTHQRQEIKLCRKSCRKIFNKEPAKYLSKLDGKKS